MRYTQDGKCHVSFLLGDDLPEDAPEVSGQDPDPLPGIIVFHEPLLVILPEHLRALCTEDAVDPAALTGVPVYPLLEPELNRITQKVFQNMGVSLVFKEDAGYLDVNTIGELSRRSGCAICPAYCASHMLRRCTSSSLFAAPLRPSVSVCIRMVFSEDQLMKEPLRSFLPYAVRYSEQPD